MRSGRDLVDRGAAGIPLARVGLRWPDLTASPASDPARPGARRLAYLAIFAVAAVLRLHNFDSTPLWTDELFTAAYPNAGLPYLWTTGLVTEPTSPLYYSLIWFIERLANDSTFALRLPSLAGSLAGIWLTGRLTQALSDRSAAPLLAMLLLALAPTSIFYAQEARPYALQGAALALALLGFARFLRAPNSGAGLALYASGAALAAWLHPTSVFAITAFNVAVLLGLLGHRTLVNQAAFWRWVRANAIVAFLCLPLLPIMLSDNGEVATSWVPALTRWSLEQMLGVTLAGVAVEPQAMRIVEIGIPLLAVLFLVPLWRPGRPAATVLLVVPGAALLLMIAASLIHPVLLSRTIAWTLIPLAAALGDVLARRHKAVGMVVFTVAAAATTLHLAREGTLKENWPRFLARLPGLSPPALVVLAPHTSPAAIHTYAPDVAAPVRMDDGGPPTPETTVIPRLYGTKTITLAELGSAIESGRRVWLIYRRPEYAWMLKTTASLPPPKEAVQDRPGSNPGIRALTW